MVASGRAVSVAGVPGLGLWENAEGQAGRFLWAASPMVYLAAPATCRRRIVAARRFGRSNSLTSVRTLSFQCLAFERWIDGGIRWSALPEMTLMAAITVSSSVLIIGIPHLGRA